MEFWEMIKSPHKSLQKTKKNINHNKAFMNITIASVVAGFGMLLLFSSSLLAGMWTVPVFAGISAFVTVLLIGILMSFVVGISAVIMTEKGKYLSGFSVMAHTIAPLSVGFLAMAAVMIVPVVGTILATIVLLPFLAIGISMMYKSVKEIYKTDMVTALVIVAVSVLTILATAMFTGVGAAGLNPMMSVI